MRAVCPGCGRVYTGGVLELGRCIHCACGSVVAPPEIDRRALHEGPPRFLADAMLGRLARWLRLLGFDTSYLPDADDGDLVETAVREKRIILTRDRRLPEEWRVGGIQVLRAEHPMAQLREIDAAVRLWPAARPFSRCARCNALLEAAPPDEVDRRVPPAVRRGHRDFFHCPGCGRIYWAGSHVARISRALRQASAARARAGGAAAPFEPGTTPRPGARGPA